MSLSLQRGRPAVAGALLAASAALVGCAVARTSPVPAIQFVHVPSASDGGPQNVDTIDGRVLGAIGPKQRVVLYARSGVWYVQPFADQPFTTLGPDGGWSSTTHLGTEYAALLVDDTFDPPPVYSTIPAPGAPGVVAVATVEGAPLFLYTWWFRLACVLALALGVLAWYRSRMSRLAERLNVRFEERLAERMRIAQELHDTLLQGFVSASMQLHVAIERLPEESPARPQLERVLALMGQVTEEGRNAVRGLRSPNGLADGLEEALASIRHELGFDDGATFRVVVEGRPRALHPLVRDEVYRVGREAIVNAFRHARAGAIDVEVRYAGERLTLVIRDDGRGIDPDMLRDGRDGHFGLSGMRERADAIGATLHVRSREGAGTEVELDVPGEVAFRPTNEAAAAKAAGVGKGGESR